MTELHMDFLRGFEPTGYSFADKSVFVTGATGSFGNAFVDYAVHRLNVGRLVVFSRDELKQFEMQNAYPHSKYPQIRFFIGDVRDAERLKLATKGVDIIVHAAALKQVMAMEYNPFECAQTNIHGAENVVRAAIENNVRKVIALSTDKAAEPINLYGASKLVSDKIFVAANNLVPARGPIFSVVRYGNVANSRGSVIPFFRKLVVSGADSLPITDPRMTRFLITLRQGVEFVCQSLQQMKGGEIFIPKLPSVRVTDLAEAIAPGLPLSVVGIRPGEKIDEVLIPRANARHVLEYDDFYIVRPELAYRDYVPPDGRQWRTVADDFCYDSATNPEFLTRNQIAQMLSAI